MKPEVVFYWVFLSVELPFEQSGEGAGLSDRSQGCQCLSCREVTVMQALQAEWKLRQQSFDFFQGMLIGGILSS